MENSYYGEYNCNLFDCIKSGQPMFLISKKAKDYWHGKFFTLLFASLILIVAMFFLVEHKPNLLLLVGGLLALAALPLKKIESILRVFLPKSVENLFVLFVSQAGIVFAITLVVGVVLLGLGFIFRVLRWEFMKKKFSKTDVQSLVQEEVSKTIKVKGKKK